MAYRKTYRRSTKSKLQVTQVLPVWTPDHASITNAYFQGAMLGPGVHDLESYIKQLPKTIAFCVLVCACIGASTNGAGGFILGAIAGLAAPVAVIWLAVFLIHFAIYMAALIGAWTVIAMGVWWLLTGIFGR